VRFLANENFPLPSVRHLREAGYDVAAITEDSPGIEDREVLARAVLERRVILTFDRDYGELIYRLGLSPSSGVIYLRYQPRSPIEPAEQLLILLQTEGLQFEGKFTVIEREQMRQRPYYIYEY
jgi:predicted nuclease of predicted toxin-antitoxin system